MTPSIRIAPTDLIQEYNTRFISGIRKSVRDKAIVDAPMYHQDAAFESRFLTTLRVDSMVGG
jgi:hypothetical protein